MYELAAASPATTASRCCSATASATTTRSPSGSPAAASSTSSSSRSTARPSPSSATIVDDIDAGRPGGGGDADQRGRTPTGSGERLIVRPDCGSTPVRSPRQRPPRRRGAATTSQGLLRAGHAPTIVHYGPDGERRGDDIARLRRLATPRSPRMIVFGAIDFAAAVARVGVVPRLPRHRLRRAAHLRDQEALPGRRRGHRRLAAPLPGQDRDRRAHRRLRADPRPQVRRAAARDRAEAAAGLPRARWARGAPTTTAPPGSRNSASTTPTSPGCTPRSASTSAARTPEETAVSVAAEIIAARWGGTGAQLRQVSGPIHREYGTRQRIHRELAVDGQVAQTS